ncbi:MAG: DUF4957 domain-containing protein [Cyclobacteriaceae bacterium]|nr:MAG: DUF4957 domain-containing protein [Cyclobacteriaceae bacterium]
MKHIYIKTLLFISSFGLFSVSCDDNIDPLVEELELARVLSPHGLQAFIRNRTTIELTWNVRDDVDHYVVEFSEDSLLFTSIIRTITVQPDELPVQEVFFGDTRYSARVKGVSAAGVADSKWSAITVLTESENIFLPLANDNIGSTEVTLSWPAGSEVTRFVINPGNVERNISAGEKAAGEATITGLSGLTNYSVTMYSGSSQRGFIEFRTLVDPAGPNTIEVQATDDLSAVIAGAAPGSILVLHPGDYLAYTGSIDINKSIEIRGYLPYNRPLLHVQFSILDAAASVVLGDLDLDGDETLNDVVRYNTAAVTYGTLKLEGCNIHDFARSFIAGNVASTVNAIEVNDCIVTNVLTSGGDFIDFRNTYVVDLKVVNSTFNNSSPGRDFIRMDAASGFSGTGLNSNVLIDHCTLYGVSNTADRILYVRFNSNSLTVQNTLIAATDGYYSNQGGTSQPTCSNNNYFSAAGFYTEAYVANAKIDLSANFTTLDPGFADAANGDFTISNQSLIDRQVGDPRWRN